MSRWPVCRHIRRLAAVATGEDAAAAAAAVKVILPDSQEHRSSICHSDFHRGEIQTFFFKVNTR